MLRKEVKDKVVKDLVKVANSLVLEIEKECSAKLRKDKLERTEQLKRIAWDTFDALIKETKNSFRQYHKGIMRDIENQW